MSCTTSANRASIHVGALAPYAVRYDITTDDETFDLTDVTAASFSVQRGDGSTASWACVVTEKTVDSCRLTHVFLTGDVSEPDELILEPRLTIPEGELVAAPVRLTVRKAFT